MLHPSPHPLTWVELLEIVVRLGQFISIWRPLPHNTYQHEFVPKDLIACLSVCRTWRDVLTPVLWEIYSDRAQYRTIPDHILATKPPLSPHRVGVAQLRAAALDESAGPLHYDVCPAQTLH